MPGSLERKHFQISVIRETAAELARLRHPKAILESFLMSALGGTGALGGFGALMDKALNVTHLIVRGDQGVTDKGLKKIAKEGGSPSPAGMEQFPFFLPQDKIERLCPRTALVVVCPLEDNRVTLVGLSPAMHGQDYNESDQDFLTGLSHLFQVSLNSALFSTRVELLNAELEKRNRDLNRQVFHLEGLRELSVETGESMDVEKFLKAFLPILLGRFFRHQGLVVVQDRSTGSVWLKSMGIEPEPVHGFENRPGATTQPLDIDRLLFTCISGVRNKHLQPLHAEPVEELGVLSDLIPGFLPESAFWFMVKEQMHGAVLLGAPLEDRHLSGQEKELLFAFVSQSVLHMKNADSFHTVLSLNQDLEKQNNALQKTIDELTRAEHRIGVLEAAVKRVAHMVTRQAERVMQVRILDFVLLIGISLVLGALFNFQNPKGIPLLPKPRPVGVITIDDAQAKQLLSKEDALLIDARPREFFEQGHAQDALNVSPALFDVVYKTRFWDENPERPLIIYGRNFSRLYDETIARKFLNRDHERVYLVEKGGRKLFDSRGGQ